MVNTEFWYSHLTLKMLSSEQKDEESDTTEADCSNTDGFLIIKNNNW